MALVDRLPRTMADEKRRAWGQQRAWAVHSIWHSPTRGPDVLLSVDLYTCNSRNAADLFTVQLLGDFEGIGMANRGDPGIGDVSFTGPREYIMVFIRANLVVMLRNAGRDLMAVDEVARQFDFRIVSKPEPRGEHPDRDMVNIQPLRSKARPGEPVPLEIGPLPSTEATIKLFSRSGQFGIEDDQGLVYRPVARGRQAIEAYVVEKAGSGRQMREFDLA